MRDIVRNRRHEKGRLRGDGARAKRPATIDTPVALRREPPGNVDMPGMHPDNER